MLGKGQKVLSCTQVEEVNDLKVHTGLLSVLDSIECFKHNKGCFWINYNTKTRQLEDKTFINDIMFI